MTGALITIQRRVGSLEVADRREKHTGIPERSLIVGFLDAIPVVELCDLLHRRWVVEAESAELSVSRCVQHL